MIQTTIITVLLTILVVLLFYASYLWDKVNDLEEELERVTKHGSR